MWDQSLLFSVLVCCLTTTNASWFRSPARRRPPAFPRGRLLNYKDLVSIRGGDSTTTEGDTTSHEEERYSRQVFALGKRAHGLIRSSTIYLDGPFASGLVYETAKNLALSGIRKLVLLVSMEEQDTSYHNQPLDDLGNAYLRAARAELADEVSDPADVLLAYLKRLNPFVEISTMRRDDWMTMHPTEHDLDTDEGHNVLLMMDRPFNTQVEMNRIARSLGTSFVAVETAGVFGRVSCDFGPSFEVLDADGEPPLETPLWRIEPKNDDTSSNEKDESLVTVRSVEGEKHDVSRGDVVRFKFRNGEMSLESCTVEKVLTPFQFVARVNGDKDTDIEAIISGWNEAVSFSRTKVPQQLSFLGLQEAASNALKDQSLFTACDLEKSWDETRRKTVFACFQALATFAKTHNRLPQRGDRKPFTTLCKEELKDDIDKSVKTHVRHFIHGCAAKFSPLQAVFGAIGAQEALKAVTGLYSPVKQFLLYDCDEVLSSQKTKPSDEEFDCEGDDAGFRHILGAESVEKIQSERVFVVGAGAIGCEILKNLAAMGVGTKNKGKVILTDMDTIEKSNLSRQFLFRDSDIGKFKSLAAKESVLRFEPSAKIEAHSAKVGSEDSVFDEEFWEKKVNIVLNALDNVDARVFIDGQCVSNQKALVDAGTLGPKGNVQVVVPFQSESYSSSVDPPDEAIPVCTLKNFPYSISHTIQWGRDLFDGCFCARPVEATQFVASLEEHSMDSVIAQTMSGMGEEAAVTWAKNLVDDLHTATDTEDPISSALSWAVKLARGLFYQAILDLLEEHPLDSRDEDGELFWTGSRRPPSPVKFLGAPSSREEELINENLVNFVQNAARLRLESYRSLADKGSSITREQARAALSSFDFEEGDHQENKGNDDGIEQRLGLMLDPLKSAKGFPEMIPAEFEKDDDTNGHVAFVTAASNLRAICYRIPPVDAMETRRVAGNIIPAMITTTAFVSALSCIEMVKLVQGVPLKKHKNAFINLALPFFAFTVPLPAESISGLNGRAYTLWDRLFIKESEKAAEGGGIKMKSLLSKIKKLASDDPSTAAVSSISLGPYLLYASFLHGDDKALLRSSVWDVIAEALEDPDEGARDDDTASADQLYAVAGRKKFDLTVVVEDVETGEEAELPVVYLERCDNK